MQQQATDLRMVAARRTRCTLEANAERIIVEEEAERPLQGAGTDLRTHAIDPVPEPHRVAGDAGEEVVDRDELLRDDAKGRVDLQLPLRVPVLPVGRDLSDRLHDRP